MILLVAFMGSLANGFDGSGESDVRRAGLIMTQISHVRRERDAVSNDLFRTNNVA